MSYLPTEPGDYKINILFADEHVPGSPYTGKFFSYESELIFELLRKKMFAKMVLGLYPMQYNSSNYNWIIVN